MTSTGQVPAKKTNPIVIILIIVVVLVCLCCCGLIAGLYFGGDALINWVQQNLNLDISQLNISNLGQ
jgi:hypothetical protein